MLMSISIKSACYNNRPLPIDSRSILHIKVHMAKRMTSQLILVRNPDSRNEYLLQVGIMILWNHGKCVRRIMSSRIDLNALQNR